MKKANKKAKPRLPVERHGPSAKPGQNRTNTQREADRAEVERLDRRGYSQREIADRLKISPSTVCADLKAIRDDYRTTRQADRAEHVALKLAQLREVCKEAWEAWDRSKDNKEKEIKEKISNLAHQAEAGAVEKLKAVITTEGRLPGNEYLRTILETLQDERELLGLDAPKKLAPTNPDGTDEYTAGGLTAAERMAGFQQLVAQFRRETAASGPAHNGEGEVLPQ
jgi:DNA-binding CsgD family transcriptional regulator